MNNKTEIALSQSEDFHQSLDTILSRQLTPDTIDTYASNALDDLVEITERVTGAYDSQPTITGLSQADSEDKAFNYFNLGDLGQSLDHVADLAESIHEIDEVIKNAIRVNTIIPPDQKVIDIQPGSGSFKEKSTYERLKTTLFILQQDFDVDIHDKERLRLTSGGTEGMMRNTSYSLIEIPELERAILVCDEEGNATYVFDIGKLIQYGKDPVELPNLSKRSLDTLIHDFPGAGKRIVYSNSFITNIKDSIMKEIIPGKPDMPEGTDNYLQAIENSLAPRDWLNVGEIAEMADVSPGSVRKIMEQLNINGEIRKQKNRGRPSPHFTPEEVQVFLVELEANPIVLQRTEGRLTANEMSRALGFTQGSPLVYELLANKESMIERVHNKPSKTYSSEVFEWLKQNDKVIKLTQGATDASEMQVEAASTIAKEWSLSPKTVEKMAKKYHMPVGSYKFGARRTEGYTLSDKRFLHNILTNEQYFIDDAELGVDFSIPAAAEEVGSNAVTVRKVIDILIQTDSSFGELTLKRVAGNRSATLSGPQVLKVSEYLTLHNMRRNSSPTLPSN